jgi:hypothetical protein
MSESSLNHAGKIPGIVLMFCPLCGVKLTAHENYTSIIGVDRKYECIPCGVLFYSHCWDNKVLWYPTASKARPWFDPMCQGEPVLRAEVEALKCGMTDMRPRDNLT